MPLCTLTTRAPKPKDSTGPSDSHAVHPVLLFIGKGQARAKAALPRTLTSLLGGGGVVNC